MPRTPLGSVPTGPGVYLLKDGRGKVIYVGKARNLRSRLRAYFGSSREPDRKVRVLREKVRSFDYILTGSETEALILESNLIKEHKPRYNVKLKDDKRYPFIKITKDEDFPRALVTRVVREDGSRYFGPYTDARAMRRTLRLIRQIFPIRQCGTFKLLPRPCLNYQIGRCLGPCTGEVSPEEYGEVVGQLCLFLEGRGDEVIRLLEEQMRRAVEDLRFEEAARLRDRIADMTKVQERQRVLTARDVSRDAVAVARVERRAYASVVRVRSGKLVACENCPLSVGPKTDEEEVVETFLKQFYALSPELPDEILLATALPDREAIETWLAERAKRRVPLRTPQRGEKRLLLAFAETNAKDALRKDLESRDPPQAVQELGDALRMSRPPRLLSAVDVSNVSGSMPVGTVVTFRDGRPDKSLYRKYRIRSVKGVDDYAMIRETVRRHVKRCEKGDCEMPDLLLIDGGKGQLSAAREALREARVRGPRLAAIAKREEEVFVPGRASPLPIPEGSKARRLLQRARDEVHRFSVEYHRALRESSGRRSALDGIEGIGENRKTTLLKRFGSVSAIAELSVEELMEVPGIGGKTARRIKEALGRFEGGDRETA
ncbi:MAG: excinuclease ABC subunit UvrC [Candidatus Eisenbacteria bacterium]|nr:excinuclease ABC subunit UvrC [Candidatus Eisenbacteria bacterium]